MNHIHRITLQLYEDNIRESKGTVVTVIVKTAPDEVLVCPLTGMIRALRRGERDSMQYLIRPASRLLLPIV